MAIAVCVGLLGALGGIGLVIDAAPVSASVPDTCGEPSSFACAEHFYGSPKARTRLAVLGDSYAAGIGAQAALGSTRYTSQPPCYQSEQSYAGQIADYSHGSVRSTLAACSGATIKDIIDTQLHDLNGSFDAVSISAGGNNIGFAKIATDCEELLLNAKACNSALTSANRTLSSTAFVTELKTLYNDIVRAAPRAHVFVVGYPYLFPQDDLSCLAGGSFALSTKLVRDVNVLVHNLDSDEYEASLEAGLGVTFINPANPGARLTELRDITVANELNFDNHSVCGNPPWLHGLIVLPTDDTVRSFHPDFQGNSAYAGLLALYMHEYPGSAKPPDDVASAVAWTELSQALYRNEAAPDGAFENAFEADELTTLRTSEPSGTAGDWGATMAPGTSPSIADVPGGYEVALQTSSNDLWLLGSAGDIDTQLGMMPGTSPSITALADGGYEVAFQSNTSNLWTYGTAGERDWGAGMAPGTSPSITWNGSGGYEVALQTNTNVLWQLGTYSEHDYALGMEPGTSPSIAPTPAGGVEIAFQSDTTNLSTVGDAGTTYWDAGMDPQSSPSITIAAGGYEVALQTNTHELWTLGTDGYNNWNLGMMPGTSPSIATVSDGGTGFEMAFQANDANLWNAGVDGTGGDVYPIEPGTSPAIAGS